MKKNLLLVSILFLSINIFGQNDFHRWQIGASFSPDYAYRTLSAEKNVDGASNIISYLNTEDMEKLSFTTGISLNYNFSSLFGLETGLFFSNKGYTSNPNISLHDQFGGWISTGRWLYTLNYIDIPLKANFHFGKRRLNYLATIGIAANFLQSHNREWLTKDSPYLLIQTELNDDFVNKANISSIIGLGLEYKLSNKFTLRAIPTFRYALSESFKDDAQYVDVNAGKILYTQISRNLWNIGIEFGIFYGIK
ncbi:MAG: PorT family protein [Paludibacter sp.]|jgi:hypothetical protein|nr:PorT family protein [Paludibacter sp.]